eukprot:3646469-Pleurochrysis_carterae.AAC.1
MPRLLLVSDSLCLLERCCLLERWEGLRLGWEGLRVGWNASGCRHPRARTEMRAVVHAAECGCARA